MHSNQEVVLRGRGRGRCTGTLIRDTTFSYLCISDDLSHKFVDYGAHCTYTLSFHTGK